MVTASTLLCMTMAIYFEARSETDVGQVLVAMSIENRINSYNYPNTACDVITEANQYSFYNEITNANPLKVKERKEWKRAEKTAKKFLADKGMYYYQLEYYGCHYHNNKVKPKWSNKLEFIRQEGNHKFYDGGC